MVEEMYVLLTSKNLYARFSILLTREIDILDFLESNYMNDISMEEIAITILGAVCPRSRISKVQHALPTRMADSSSRSRL